MNMYFTISQNEHIIDNETHSTYTAQTLQTHQYTLLLKCDLVHYSECQICYIIWPCTRTCVGPLRSVSLCQHDLKSFTTYVYLYIHNSGAELTELWCSKVRVDVDI